MSLENTRDIGTAKIVMVGAGGGASYNAGTGIDITNNTIHNTECGARSGVVDSISSSRAHTLITLATNETFKAGETIILKSEVSGSASTLRVQYASSESSVRDFNFYETNGTTTKTVTFAVGTVVLVMLDQTGYKALVLSENVSGGADALSDLTDTNISTPTNGQVLGYNSTSGKWENQTPSGMPENPLATTHGGTGNTQGYIWTGASSGSSIGTGATIEGNNNTGSGDYAHAQGTGTQAIGDQSFTSGYYTTAGHDNQTALGKYNDNKTGTLFEVGNGTASNAKSNAFEVYSDGKLSCDNGTSKFQFTQSSGVDGYKDASGTFHAFGSGSGNTTTKTRYTISSSNWSANPDSGGYYTYALTLNPTIGSSPDVYIAGSGDDYQPTNNQKNMFAHVSRCMVNGSTLTLYALEKPTSNFYVWVEGIEGTTSTDIVGNVIQPNLSNAVTSRTRYTVNSSSWSASANADGYYTQQISMYPSVESNLEIYLAGSTDATQPTSTERNMFAYLERCKVNSVYLTLYAKTKPTSTFYVWAEGVNGESSTDVVGNVIQPNGESSGAVDYSTSEVATGEHWIDGKMIYRKCYDWGALPNATSVYKNVGIPSGATIVNMWGIATTGLSGGTINLPYVDRSIPTNSVGLYYQNVSNELAITTGGDRSSYNGIVVMEYTKS